MLPTARRAIAARDVDVVISTGSAIAVPFLTAAAASTRRPYYIESATRADGPSFTGRILATVPRVRLRTQSPIWAGRRWKFVGSVFEGWTAVEHDSGPIRRVVVSLGTMQTYQFRSLVDRLIAVLPADVEVLWQVGVTDVSDLSITGRSGVPADELRSAMQDADVVVAHAGTGIALSAMEVGKCPVLVPRRASRNEHVDDHQLQTATRLAADGVAIVTEVEALDWSHLRRAARTRILPRAGGSMIDLDQ
jgi:UDP-N-acetylglucosamine transferase subunit ALG13